jgi:glutamyl-tRNA reductase
MTAASKMQIAMIGINHHGASVEVRECVAVPTEEKHGLCAELIDTGHASEAVVLSTCNRTEIYLRADDLDEATHFARSELVARATMGQADAVKNSIVELREIDAVRHLLEVATSLDSLVIGEPHIIGQVRDDFNRAREAGSVGKQLGRLFLRALELAKASRNQTAIGDNPVSVSSIAMNMAARVFGDIKKRSVLVLGAGEMGRQTAILAAHRGAQPIMVCSRNSQHAGELADRVGGTIRLWEKREQAMIESDIIISSTGAPHPIIGREQIKRVMHARLNRPVFLIDIALPRDVAPEVDTLYNVYRYDLDDLTTVARENEELRHEEVDAVVPMINKAQAEYERWSRELKVVPDIVRLREHVEEIRRVEVDSYLRRMHSLDDRDRNLLEAMSSAITAKILHTPTVRLKDAADAGVNARHTGSMRYLFDLDSEKDGHMIPKRNREEDDDE